MAKNIKQVYDANPSTSLGNNDLIYVGLSPFGLTSDSAIKYSDVFAQLAGSFIQTTGGVTAGHIPVYGASALQLKDSGIAVSVGLDVTNVNSITLTVPLALTSGGTNASLTASNGGIFYSTASAGAILAGTATAGKVLQSGATAPPTWSTPTYPSASGSAGQIIRSNGTNNIYSTSTFADTYSASNLLYSNGANTVAGLATANSAQLVTNSSGVPAMTATMTDAQVVFGNTGATPAPGAFVAGTGIGLNYSGGNLTISTSAAATNVNPNIIIGGNMDVAPWAAGTSFAAAANDSRIGDRFRWFKVGTGIVTAAKTALAPSEVQAGIFLTNCLSITVTTADASIAATDLYQIKYAVEGSDWTQVYQQAMTLSFWMQATVTGKYGVSVQNSAGTRCYIAECNYTVGNAWQQFVINIPADTTGVFSITPGTVGAYITWTLAAGSNFQGSTGWQTSGSAVYCTSNQPNNMATNNNVLYITLPYLQPGTFTAPAYPYESQADVLARCQRYYETSQCFEAGFYFPNADQTGGLNFTVPTAGTGAFEVYVPFKVRKAIVPTMTLCDNTATTGKVFKGAGGKTANTAGVGQSGFNGGTSDATSSGNMYFQWQADAEIF